MKFKMPVKVTRAASTAALKLRKNSPAILMAAGTVTFVGALVMSRKAALKSQEIVANYKKDIGIIKEAEAIVAQKEEKYPEYNPNQERLEVVCQTVSDLALTYLPVVGLSALSLTCFFTAHNILNKRYLGAVAAFNSLSDTFAAYRNRVIGEEGEKKDRHYMYGTTFSEEIVTEKDENGNEVTKVVKTENTETDAIMPSEYVRIFDEDNPNWDRNPAFNLMFLRSQQTIANNILHARGHLLLNEVYEMCGFKQTPMGAYIGWSTKGDGDGFVDFGLYDDSKEVRRFINGNENTILLNFNVDGFVLDKI